MRVNVYGEELTSRVELVTKVVEDPDGQKHEFYGVRFWLKFPTQPWWVHRKTDGVDDDDSTAVTFWATSKLELAGIFVKALDALDQRVDTVRGEIES